MIIHIDLDTLVEDLEKRGFSRDVAERARAALAAPNNEEKDDQAN